ncbi:mammalian cell entry protein [Gordonia sp. NPDC003429]
MTRTREPSSRSLRMRGIVAVLVAAAVVALLVLKPFSGGPDTVRFAIDAPSLPDGVQEGIPVDIRGETVGSVCGLDVSRRDVTRMEVCVRPDAMGELTQDTAVSFVSRNLFGSDAVRLNPTGSGSPVTGGSVIALAQPPSDYTMTATVRSAGSFTLPVLTPELTALLNQLSDTTIRMAPFLTSAMVALQTLQRGQTSRLAPLLPTAADALNGVGAAGAGAITSLITITTNPLLSDHHYTEQVTQMIGDIGDLFGGMGALFNGMAGFGAFLDLTNAFATPMRQSLEGVTPAQVGALIDHFGGAFHTDPATGRTTLSVSANLDLVPGVATPLNQLLAGARSGS